MKTSSAKAKGRKLQDLVRDSLRSAFMEILETNDIKSQVMGMSGEDIVFSPKAQKIIKYKFECKNTERLSIWSAIEQCEGHGKDSLCPVIVFKKNKKKPYAAIPLNKLIALLKAERYNYVNKKDVIGYETKI
mgnify:CR=1 FL=1